MAKAEAVGRRKTELEFKADNDWRRFTRILQEGAFLPAMRGDLSRLAESLDRIADAIGDAMRAILLKGKLADC